MKLTKNKLAAAIGVAAIGLSSQAGAVVVVGGNNGWEVSFDGNVNAFYQTINCDIGCDNVPGSATAEDSSRVTSGFLPAFFSFNVKSPTVNGLTGSGRISFAPAIHTGKAHTNVALSTAGAGGIEGSTIDTREVVANISGNFGTISFGRTLSLFGRKAILKDMTLFGTGGNIGGSSIVDNSVVTTGRVGYGYVYPDFQTRISYATPVTNGFQAEIGLYDPAEPGGVFGGGNTTFETDTPRFEGEVSYATAFSGGSINIWADFTWQEVTTQTGFVTGNGLAVNAGQDYDAVGFGVGGQIAASGFEGTGYYYTGDNLGTVIQFAGFDAPVANAAGSFQDKDNDGYYLQGTYTFNGKTKVGVSYGESRQDSDAFYFEVEQQMWSVGVYHDVNSWLKLIAEYNDAETEVETFGTTQEYDSFAVGAFLFW